MEKQNINHIKEIYKNFLNLDIPTEIINKNWSRTGGDHKISSLHSIASYLAMFAPAVPEYFINKYSHENAIVFDPFSGRGTTALRSRELKRQFIGSDLNPYALVLSKFKISKIYKTTLIKRILYWKKIFMEKEKKWFKETYNEKNKELLYYYHRKTLSNLLFIREKIGKTWNKNSKYNNAILAFVTGLMHGPSRKNGDTIYFSVSKPNTISMSPNYVKNYVKKNNLKIPLVDVFQKVIDRINTKYDNIIEKEFKGKIYNYNATNKNPHIKNNSIDLVVTSPPYLSIVNYTNSNWLKLWILGYERKKLNNQIKLTDNLKYKEYIVFIKKFLNNIYFKLKKGAKVCLIVGDVHGKKLIESVWKEIQHEVKYIFLELYYDKSYSQNRKITNMLNSKKGKATRIEKVLVLEKI